MKRISISWRSRSTWGGAVLLAGLLLSTCDPTGSAGSSHEVKPGSPPEPCSIGTELRAIGDEAGLRAIKDDPSCSYFLTKNITLTKTWVPIDLFIGVLDGKGKTISGLTIVDTSSLNVGFFKTLGGAVVKDLSFDAPTVTGLVLTAVLAGTSRGSIIENIKITNGVVTGAESSTGGLVGTNYSIIKNSSVAGEVSSGSSAGGLVGENIGTIENSYAASEVSVSTSTSALGYAGGLAGWNSGTITNSYARGKTSSSTGIAGGLVSQNSGVIRNSYAGGVVNGDEAGGLVGENAGTIENSYATNEISVSTSASDLGYAGGLVGKNYRAGTIKNSYASGAISSSNDPTTVGGLVGWNLGIITSSYYDIIELAQAKGIGQDDNTNSQTVQGVSAAASIVMTGTQYYDSGVTPTATEIFVGWDFADIWVFDAGKWPTLKWQQTLTTP